MLNRKSFLLLTLVAVAAKADVNVSATKKELKVCYIDSLAAMRDSKAGQIVTVELESKRKRVADDLQRREKEFTADVKMFQDKSPTMSPMAREDEQKRLAKMERDLKLTMQEKEEDFKVDMQRATEKLSKELDEAVFEFARAEKYDIVVDKITGRVVYSAADQEPTTHIVSIMDRNHEKRGSSGKQSSTAVASSKTSSSSKSNA